MLKPKIEPRAIAGGLLIMTALIGFILSSFWPLWLILLGIGMVLLSLSLSDKYEYQCQKCQGIYKLGFKGILASKHGQDKEGNYAIARCPHCGAITKARESRSHDKKKK
jgi:DNA-directed RNA polymerase subunit RPC12/RpoP